MDLEAIAEEIINHVQGIKSDKNKTEVVAVLASIIDMANDLWETWLVKHTNKCLQYTRTCCDCGREIVVFRYGDSVEYDIQ